MLFLNKAFDKKSFKEENIKEKKSSKKQRISNSTIKLNASILLLIILFKIVSRKELCIDNLMIFDKENDLNFSKFTTTVKAIAIYNINYTLIDKTPKADNNIMINQLTQHIELAKSHGIYGFGFYYFWPPNQKVSDDPMDILLLNKTMRMNFLLILEKNEEDKNKLDINVNQLFFNLKRYISDERYIKFFNKSVIVITQNTINENEINHLRHRFIENDLGELFILSSSNDYYNTTEVNISNGILYTTSYDSLEKVIFQYNKTFGYFYTHLLYYNLFEQIPFNNIFRTTIPLSKYPFYIKKKRTIIYEDYSPDKFYFLNKIIIHWTQQNYDKDNQYIFIDGFKELEPNDNFGYANINSFSKALYGFPLINDNEENLNLVELEKDVLVMVQVHVYYTDLFPEIISKTNNIPVPFDLYITTNTQEKKFILENCLKTNTLANKYEILITQNKGRDVIPCLIQLKNVLMKYKYFCHIHTKKHGETHEFGIYWQTYLFENLLGNKKIVKQILSNFEKYEKLGFLFPENFYKEIKFIYDYYPQDLEHINSIFEILFPKNKIKAGDIKNFPAGNMFWARTSAVYQIFNDSIINLAQEEKGQLDGTIAHGIERFWLYLVKLNGFYYNTFLYYI